MRINPLNSISDQHTSPSTPSEAANSAVAVRDAVVGYPYSTRVGSTTYSGNVQQFANVYEGTIDNLIGVRASGPSVKQVEEHLGNLISFFA